MAGTQGNPTVLRRRLGIELREHREAAGKTLDDVAEATGWSDSKVSRIENGRIAVTWGDVSDLLDLYGVTDAAVRDPLITLAREARKQGWWHVFVDLLNKPYATYIGLEGAAAMVSVFEPLSVPGQLQTEAYTRAVTQTTTRDLSDSDIDRLVEVRMRRQESLFGDDDPPRLNIVIDEAVLRREVGGPAVMHEQLQRLIDLARHPRVRLQILAFVQGAHVGMSGSFTVFRFPEPTRDPDIAFADTVAGSLFLERPGEVKATRDAFDELTAQALSREDSLDLLATISAEYMRRCSE
jgi:transcriptional regulator with XRE-family HTH domain